MITNYFRNSQVTWKSLYRRRVVLNNIAMLNFYFPKPSGWLEKHSSNTNTFLWEFNVLLDRVMVLNSVYIPILSLNSGFSIADFLCRCVQFAMQSKLEQPCHLPWHGFMTSFGSFIDVVIWSFLRPTLQLKTKDPKRRGRFILENVLSRTQW